MAGDDERELSVNDGDLILREGGKVVGIHSRDRSRRKPEPPQEKPEPKRHTRHEAAKKIARTVVESTVKVTENEALVQAAELISDASERFKRNERLSRKPKSPFSIGAALAAQIEKLKNRKSGG